MGKRLLRLELEKKEWDGGDLAETLHAWQLQKDAIKPNCSHCAVITCAQLLPDFHLAPGAPANY